MAASQLPGPASTARSEGEVGGGLARHSVGLAGTLFQSITFMAPGAAVATSLAVGAIYAGGALPLSILLTMIAALVMPPPSASWPGICLAYLLRRHPTRVHDMDKVFD